MYMEEIYLDYLKDTEGNYILKNKMKDGSDYNGYLRNVGTYDENLIIARQYFEKKLKHRLDDIVKEIESSIITKQHIVEDDFIYERFIAKIKPEEEFNPMFQLMNDQEIAEYTKYSRKVRVEIDFEIHIKPKRHLMFSSLINSLIDFRK